ncbi:MAG TPA: transcriptional regulator [Treponemataceae bacterium]|nr:transcriptional regulator [Treponemataceae bacterium]
MNKIIHEQTRLRILAALAGELTEVSFPELRDRLGMTAGNLSVQLKTLEDAGYVQTNKSFVANKPRTDIAITDGGRQALTEYLEEIERMLASLRKGE